MQIVEKKINLRSRPTFSSSSSRKNERKQFLEIKTDFSNLNRLKGTNSETVAKTNTLQDDFQNWFTLFFHFHFSPDFFRQQKKLWTYLSLEKSALQESGSHWNACLVRHMCLYPCVLGTTHGRKLCVHADADSDAQWSRLRKKMKPSLFLKYNWLHPNTLKIFTYEIHMWLQNFSNKNIFLTNTHVTQIQTITIRVKLQRAALHTNIFNCKIYPNWDFWF
jgi:hypothetical protein